MVTITNTLALIGNFSTVAMSIRCTTKISDTIIATDRRGYQAGNFTLRLATFCRWIANLTIFAVIVFFALIAAFAFVGNFNTSALSHTAITIGFSIHTTNWIPLFCTQTRLIALTNFTAIGIEFVSKLAEKITGQRFAIAITLTSVFNFNLRTAACQTSIRIGCAVYATNRISLWCTTNKRTEVCCKTQFLTCTTTTASTLMRNFNASAACFTFVAIRRSVNTADRLIDFRTNTLVRDAVSGTHGWTSIACFTTRRGETYFRSITVST